MFLALKYSKQPYLVSSMTKRCMSSNSEVAMKGNKQITICHDILIDNIYLTVLYIQTTSK